MTRPRTATLGRTAPASVIGSNLLKGQANGHFHRHDVSQVPHFRMYTRMVHPRFGVSEHQRTSLNATCLMDQGDLSLANINEQLRTPCPPPGGEAVIRGSRCLLWSDANDPSATSSGLKFRSVAVACAISFAPKRGKALSSETAHSHQTPRPSVFAQDDGRRTEPATTELRRMVSRVGARPNAA